MLAMWYDIIPALGAGALAVVACLGWWRTKGMDAATEQARTESGHAAHVTQAVDALESVIKALQEDREFWRGNSRELEREISKLRSAKDVVSEAKGRIAEIENGTNGP